MEYIRLRAKLDVLHRTPCSVINMQDILSSSPATNDSLQSFSLRLQKTPWVWRYTAPFLNGRD